MCCNGGRKKCTQENVFEKKNYFILKNIFFWNFLLKNKRFQVVQKHIQIHFYKKNWWKNVDKKNQSVPVHLVHMEGAVLYALKGMQYSSFRVYQVYLYTLIFLSKYFHQFFFIKMNWDMFLHNLKCLFFKKKNQKFFSKKSSCVHFFFRPPFLQHILRWFVIGVVPSS